ncbi:adenosylhomocysteinase [Haloarculaceae archaeon H-GB2-1]|nr:adenosylhomocysteinase [Haloarculaceae archaeon H-GB1-1]MEA5407037.1 adenosylhomocysteinase [Haloarculaceae archaeon H-GB2-1]
MTDEHGDREDPLAWARDHMPIHESLAEQYGESEPFDGYTVAVASHLETNTGVLIETLSRAGAEVLFTPSEPQSTHGDVVAFLDSYEGITAYAEEGMSDEEFAEAHHTLLEEEPDLILDDGSELIAKVHESHPGVAEGVIGGAEQTTAGITRLEAMDDEGVLEFPVYGVNDTPMKHCFDNVHGTGESSLTNVAITTNAILSGKTVVVAGYGYCGRGIARKARGLGAQTVVTEVDPRKALEAHMDGHRVTNMAEAAEIGELFITTTGTADVIRGEHFEAMPDGATLCNAGHFDVEIDQPELAEMAETVTHPKEGVTRYTMPDGRDVNLLSDGRLVNLTGPYSQGHPAEVMDTTFAMMFEAGRDIRETDLEPGLYAVPDRLDRGVAERKLETLDATIDEPTDSQREYDSDWRETDSGF